MDNLKILFLILAVIAMLFGIYQSIEVYILKRKRKKRIKEFDQLLLKQIDSFKAYQLSYTELMKLHNKIVNEIKKRCAQLDNSTKDRKY